MRGLGIIVFVIAMLSYTACTTMPFRTEPRSIILSGKTYSETYIREFVYWRCEDFVSRSDTLFGPRTLFELGILTNSKLSASGFVLYDGGNSGELTNYERRGINHRWDWGPNGAEFAFTIKPDGTGLFYDFSSTQSGERIKPSGMYKCYQ